jgi:hypothetical protein
MTQDYKLFMARFFFIASLYSQRQGAQQFQKNRRYGKDAKVNKNKNNPHRTKVENQYSHCPEIIMSPKISRQDSQK